MGCRQSNAYSTNVYAKVPQLMEFRRQFRALKLSEADVGQYYTAFRKIDDDGSGSVDILEFLMYFDVERTRFTKRVFGIFDLDGSGKMDFKEFVFSLWNYCTLDKDTLILFAFDIYDRDKSGCIDIAEALLLIKDVYGKKFYENAHAQRVYSQMEKLDQKDLTLEVFQSFAQKHPALLYPAFAIQLTIQQRIFGERYWATQSQLRLKYSRGKFLTVEEFMHLHMAEVLREEEEENRKRKGVKTPPQSQQPQTAQVAAKRELQKSHSMGVPSQPKASQLTLLRSQSTANDSTVSSQPSHDPHNRRRSSVALKHRASSFTETVVNTPDASEEGAVTTASVKDVTEHKPLRRASTMGTMPRRQSVTGGGSELRQKPTLKAAANAVVATNAMKRRASSGTFISG